MDADLCLIAIAIIASVALLSIWKPKITLVSWIVLLPVQLNTVEQLGFRLAPADLVLIGILFGLVAEGWMQKTCLVRRDRALVFALALGVWFCVTVVATLSSLGTVPQHVVVNKIIGFGALLAIYWVTIQTLQSEERINWSLRWYLKSGSIWNIVGLGAYAIWRWQGIWTPFMYGGSRLRGLLVDPNSYGGFLVSLFILQMAMLAMNRHSERQGWYFVNAGLLLFGIILTVSRSAWLALVVGSVALVAFLPWRGKRRVLQLGLVVGIVSALLIWLNADSLKTFTTLASRWPQVAVRYSLVQQGLKEFISSPVWGIGLGVFSTLGKSGGHIVHTTYIWLLAETGAIGLFFFLGFLLSLYREYRAIRAFQVMSSPYLVIGMGAVVVAWLGFMIGIEGLYQRHFWFLCGTIGALYRIAVEQQKSSRNACALADQGYIIGHD